MLDRVDELLAGVALIKIDETVLTEAETITPAAVATLDAIPRPHFHATYGEDEATIDIESMT